jgi:hypothetical protein
MPSTTCPYRIVRPARERIAIEPRDPAVRRQKVG